MYKQAIRDAEIAITNLNSQIEQKNRLIEVVDDMLTDDNSCVSSDFLNTKKKILSWERHQLAVELELRKHTLAFEKGELRLFA